VKHVYYTSTVRGQQEYDFSFLGGSRTSSVGGHEEAVLQKMKKKEPPNEFAYERHVNILYLHVFSVFFISLCAY